MGVFQVNGSLYCRAIKYMSETNNANASLDIWPQLHLNSGHPHLVNLAVCDDAPFQTRPLSRLVVKPAQISAQWDYRTGRDSQKGTHIGLNFPQRHGHPRRGINYRLKIWTNKIWNNFTEINIKKRIIWKWKPTSVFVPWARDWVSFPGSPMSRSSSCWSQAGIRSSKYTPECRRALDSSGPGLRVFLATLNQFN